MRLGLFLFIFLILSGLLIISNNNLSFSNSENIQTFGHLYVSWLDGIYSNVQILTGDVIGANWFPE